MRRRTLIRSAEWQASEYYLIVEPSLYLGGGGFCDVVIGGRVIYCPFWRCVGGRGRGVDVEDSSLNKKWCGNLNLS